MTGPVRAVLRKVLVAAFLVAVAVGAAVVVGGHGAEIAALLARPAARWSLVPALAALAAWLLLGVQTWRGVLASLGSRLGFAAGARICFAAIAGTYLPGPWWQALAAAHTGRQTGVPAGRVVAAYLLVAVVNLLSATAVGLLAAPLVLGASWPWLAVPLLLGAYVVWRPETVLRLTDRAARLLRRAPPADRPDPRGLRRALLVQTAAWLAGGLHLWLLAYALGAPPGPALAAGVGGYAFASAAGALVLVLPDGAGVRELVIIAALGPVLPVPAATVAAIGSRACLVVAELLCAGGLLVSAWRGRRGANPARPG
ncbi:lysylphosphatidylglycerol synthase domain-containing protein [Amycolatopsis sp. NPDC024027]|uniref:lysylphosphatidylglycerol synthase domain-containing protein n=1 Tax=Amycolatopsis sp. NPDC024027 TaxID=3154327 RepID=UPI0033EC4867